MSDKCTLTINGKKVAARVGETLVDAALGGWIVLPHDCCVGQCQSCRCRVVGGAVDGQGTDEDGTVLGCLATVQGDAEIRFDEVPTACRRSGTVTEVTQLTPDVYEVVIALKRPLHWLAGQYVSAAFAGLPPRYYSPSPRMNGDLSDMEIVLHIERQKGGLVSGEIGRRVKPGCRVRLRGPYGHAFYRAGPEPLVLVSGGTGFAPLFSIARQVMHREPDRQVTLVAGASHADTLYMHEAVDWLRANGLSRVTMTISRSAPARGALAGRPTDHMPDLDPSQVVYAAGSPRLVEAVRQRARDASARYYADPFLPGPRRGTLRDRLRSLVTARSRAAGSTQG